MNFIELHRLVPTIKKHDNVIFCLQKVCNAKSSFPSSTEKFGNNCKLENWIETFKHMKIGKNEVKMDGN